jgi:glutamine synthetase
MSKAIRFEGNGYGDEWVKEAKKRGLSNFNDTPSALAIWKDKKVQKMFHDLNVLTPEEIHARYEIELENYSRRRDIEAALTVNLAVNHIIPAAIHYQSDLLHNVAALKEVLSASEVKDAASTQLSLIKGISKEVNELKKKADRVAEERLKAVDLPAEKQARNFASVIKPLMDEARDAADRLEMIVEDEAWPLPKMREILFTR